MKFYNTDLKVKKLNKMNIEELHIKFKEIIEKYNFNSSKKAQELTNYIVSKSSHNALDLSKHFNIEIEEAKVILEFLKKGIEFKNSTQTP